MSFFGLLLLAALFFFVIRPIFRILWRAYRQKRALEEMWRQMCGQDTGSRTNSRRHASKTSKTPHRKKKIPKDVGEYVDYEEIDEHINPNSPKTDDTKRYTGPAEPQVSDAEWEDLPPRHP